MSAEWIFLLRLAALSGLMLGLDYLAARRVRRRKARLPRFFRRNRAELPEVWRRSLERTYGGPR